MNQNVFQKLIFDGFYSEEFKLDSFFLCIGTLTQKDSDRVFSYSKYLSSKFDNFCFIIDLLSCSIKAINGQNVHYNDIKFVLENAPSYFVLKLYDIYKSFVDSLTDEINDNFEDFTKSNESKKRWILFKNGYRFEEPLSDLQMSWIQFNYYIDKNEEFERQYSLAKYTVNQITHAIINPKSYVQHIKQEKHNESIKQENKEDQKCSDLTKAVFNSIKEQHERSDDIKASEIWDNAINSNDDHDGSIRTQEIERFKTELRKLKIRFNSPAKPTRIIRPNINIGYKQEVFLDNEEVVKKNQAKKSVFKGIDFETVLNAKAFADIKNKELILEEILKEENSEQYIDDKPSSFEKHSEKLQKKEIKREEGKPRGKSLREIMFEKGIEPHQLNKMKLNEIKKELTNDL